MKTEKMETLSFQHLLKRSEDIFEAVAVLGQRGRQVVNRRAAERMLLEQDEPEEEFEESMEPLEENEDYVEEEKETVVAMQDYLGKKLTWRYSSAGEQEDGGEAGDTKES
jgi:hypothetical protein